MVCETVCTIVNTILCCTQKYKRAEDVDIKMENIQSKTEDEVKIIIEPEKNASIKPSCIPQAYESQKPNSESLKRSTQNIVSTDNSKLGNYIRFAKKCKCGQQEQQNASEDEIIKLQVIIVTDKHYCGNLSEVDEPHRHNVPEIDIRNPEVTVEASQSRRLPQPQLLVTSSTRNSQCRAGNSTTSTSYLPIKEQEPYRKKQDRINSYLTSTKVDRTKKSSKGSFHLSKYITRIFRHSAPEIKIK
ncbi:uncharacterized protein LOC112467303 [Temnothorax curvispinosus]|uniref:Uncharacterized protein LOC112467303 n=1 Tax=Temnothorax curvispinosus TaxID=300111 RepID=A0A6J1RA89_9HYME|nr:uncharacterized protein LOC112467303 [Temnothorax curvispinosus]